MILIINRKINRLLNCSFHGAAFRVSTAEAPSLAYAIRPSGWLATTIAAPNNNFCAKDRTLPLRSPADVGSPFESARRRRYGRPFKNLENAARVASDA